MDSRTVYHYMVEFDLSLTNLQEVSTLVPAQQERVNELFLQGKIHTYSLAADYNRLWAIFVVDNESELVHLIESLPVTPYMDYNYRQLLYHQSIGVMPEYSLN